MKPTPSTPKQTPIPTASKPAHEFRFHGVQGTIWQNETEKGARYNTTFKRYYRDGQEWKSSDSFGQGDLLTLAFVAQEAARWIMCQRPPSQATGPEN